MLQVWQTVYLSNLEQLIDGGKVSKGTRNIMRHMQALSSATPADYRLKKKKLYTWSYIYGGHTVTIVTVYICVITIVTV
jgi:hypothetical protein